MSIRAKFILTALVVALAGFLLAPQSPLGQQVWPAPLHDARPDPALVPGFMLIGVLEALAMGIAVAFLVFGWPYTKALVGGGAYGVLLHLSVAWLFGNFWLHDNVHMINGMNFSGLLVIDYVFHVPIMAAGVLVAHAIVKVARERAGAPADAKVAAPAQAAR